MYICISYIKKRKFSSFPPRISFPPRVERVGWPSPHWEGMHQTPCSGIAFCPWFPGLIKALTIILCFWGCLENRRLLSPGGKRLDSEVQRVAGALVLPARLVYPRPPRRPSRRWLSGPQRGSVGGRRLAGQWAPRMRARGCGCCRGPAQAQPLPVPFPLPSRQPGS